jgi:hypothetical protein
VGGNSDAGLRRAVRLGEAWHPLRFTMPWLREAAGRMTALAGEQRWPVPGLAPRIALRLTGSPVTGPGRLAGEGTIDQVLGDLAELRVLGADTADGWAGLGRIVYATSSQQLGGWLADLGVSPAPVLLLAITQVVPGLVVAGPVPGLVEQVRDLHRRFRSA